MEQQNLFGGLDAPKRPDPKRRRIPLGEMSCGRFKAEKGIVCWKTNAEEEPWVAFKNPPGHEGKGPVDVIAELAQWLEDKKFMTYGDTQYQALTRLCDAQGIMMPLHMRKEG